MALTVIDNHIMAAHQCLNGTLTPLITEVEQEGILFLHEVREVLLQFFMKLGLPTHHARPHGISHSPILGCIGVRFADIRMVGQSEVIVDTPNQHFFPPKHHPIGDVALKLGEGEIPVGILGMLAKWSAVIADAVENVQNGLFC